MSNPAKRWMCTTFNLSDEILADVAGHYRRLWESGHFKFIAGQLERCPTTHRLHLQSFYYFNDKKRMAQVKQIVGESHCSVAEGKDEHCREYCSKTDTRVEGPFQHGTLDSNQGQRTDLQGACDLVKAGKSIADVANEFPVVFTKYPNGLRQLHNLVNGRELLRPPVKVSVFYGVSNCGKTHYVMQQMKGKSFHRQKAPYQFWDGLESDTQVLLLDDFRGEMPFQDFLQIVDDKYLRLQVKGSSVSCRFTEVWITSNLSPYQWYPAQMVDKTSRTAFRRRLSEVYWITNLTRNVPADFVINPTFVENAEVPEDEFPAVI